MMADNLLAERAWDLVCEYVQDAGLRRHMLAVGAAMGWYADHLGEDRDYWEAIGRIHDFDWEIHPNLNEHPMDWVHRSCASAVGMKK